MRISSLQKKLLLHAALYSMLLCWMAGCHVLHHAGSKGAAEPESGRVAQLRTEVTAYAQQHQGVRYTPAGKTPASGFDCSGFTSYVMQRFGIRLSASARDQATQGRPQMLEKAKPGDLVFFRRSPSEPIFHVAMVLSNNHKGLFIIHSTTSRGVVVDNLLQSTYWKPKIDSVRDVILGR